MNGYVTTKEVAAYYKVTEQTVYNWRQEGLPYKKLGRAVRFDLDEIEQWFDNRHSKLPFEG